MFNWLRKKDRHIQRLHSSLSDAFRRVRDETRIIFSWLRHFHERQEEHEACQRILYQKIEEQGRHFKSHDEKIMRHELESESHGKKLDEHKAIISELYHKIREMEKSIDETKRSSFSAEKKKGQVGTLQGTSKGHLRDKSGQVKHAKKHADAAHKKGHGDEARSIITERLQGAFLEILDVMYKADRPLSYSEIGSIVGKKEKSIRNIVCELRKTGIKIRSIPVGIRKKGFYIDEKQKIEISGR